MIDLSPRLRLAALAFIALLYLHNTLPYLTMMPRVNVDEPWLMERAYQVMKTGVPRQPMYGLSNAYMLQAGYPYLLAGWMEVFGVGLRQARMLGVALGLAIVVMIASLGRRLVGTVAGLSAALFLAADSNFLGGVRNARSDIPAVCFAVAALTCYVLARDKVRGWWFFLSGVSAGLAMLCHGNAFWVAVIVGAWFIIDHGRRVFFRPAPYWFAGGVTLVLGPYFGILLFHWTEVRRQIATFAADRVPGSSVGFILRQMALEIERYRDWYFGLVTNSVPNPLLWVFQAAVVAGLCVLVVRIVGHRNRPDQRSGERHLLALVLGGSVIFAAFVNNKVPVYLPHLLIGLSLGAGLAVAQGLSLSAVRASGMVFGLFVLGYGSASIVYYEKWYSTQRKSELVPYEQTAATLRALVPAGPKDLYASPHFWLPFHDDERTSFISYGGGMKTVSRDREVFLLVDESQWLPDMNAPSGVPGFKQRWVEFIQGHCALDRMALGTAYGTIALFRCGLGPKPAQGTPAIIGGARMYHVGQRLQSLSASDLMQQWTPYADPRRQSAQRPELRLTSEGLRVAGTGWPGVVTQYAVVPGETYLVRVAAAHAGEGDLLYLGTWSERQVLSLSGAASSGMPTPLAHESWFPGDRAFIATAPHVQLLIYSEAPRPGFTVSSVDILRLQPEPVRAR